VPDFELEVVELARLCGGAAHFLAFVDEPGPEEGGGVEVGLQAANYFGGGDGRGFVDCCGEVDVRMGIFGEVGELGGNWGIGNGGETYRRRLLRPFRVLWRSSLWRGGRRVGCSLKVHE
jgi:hypothetical protein